MSSASAVEDPRINSRIVTAYRQKTPGSADLAKQALELLPSGIAHDARNVDPYGIYVARAQGPHKWDVDGNEYRDFFGGHGSGRGSTAATFYEIPMAPLQSVAQLRHANVGTMGAPPYFTYSVGESRAHPATPLGGRKSCG